MLLLWTLLLSSSLISVSLSLPISLENLELRPVDTISLKVKELSSEVEANRYHMEQIWRLLTQGSAFRERNGIQRSGNDEASDEDGGASTDTTHGGKLGLLLTMLQKPGSKIDTPLSTTENPLDQILNSLEETERQSTGMMDALNKEKKNIEARDRGLHGFGKRTLEGEYNNKLRDALEQLSDDVGELDNLYQTVKGAGNKAYNPNKRSRKLIHGAG